MSLLDLPDEVHLELAKYIGQEQQNNHYGIVMSCRRFNNIYTPFLYFDPLLNNHKPYSSNVHKFVRTIETKPWLKQLVKTLDMDILYTGQLLKVTGWEDIVLKAVKELGPDFENSSRWKDSLLQGHLPYTIGLALLRIPRLEQLTLSVINSRKNANELGFDEVFLDIPREVVVAKLPPVRYIKSRRLISSVQFAFPSVAKVKFVVPPMYVKWFYFIRNNITSMTLELSFPLRAALNLQDLLLALVHLRTFKAKRVSILPKTEPYELPRLIGLFPPSSPLETLAISLMEDMSEIRQGTLLPFENLWSFNSLRHLNVPQLALHQITSTRPRVQTRLLQALVRLETLKITGADSNCHLVAADLSKTPNTALSLRHVHVEYLDSYDLRDDVEGPWEELAKMGVTVVRNAKPKRA